MPHDDGHLKVLPRCQLRSPALTALPHNRAGLPVNTILPCCRGRSPSLRSCRVAARRPVMFICRAWQPRCRSYCCAAQLTANLKTRLGRGHGRTLPTGSLYFPS
jgi:hypothetical protein